jgi:hypothetical protein
MVVGIISDLMISDITVMVAGMQDTGIITHEITSDETIHTIVTDHGITTIIQTQVRILANEIQIEDILITTIIINDYITVIDQDSTLLRI